MQQSEVSDLRNRLKEKETTIDKKNQQLQTIQLEKHQRDSDMLELRDQMDIKERKVNVLNRKIDNLEEQLKDKEMLIATLRSKLNLNSTSTYHTNVMQTLEQTLEQKEKLIEKLTKESNMNRGHGSANYGRERELNEQIDTLNITIKELNEKIELKNKEIQDYQVGFCSNVNVFKIWPYIWIIYSEIFCPLNILIRKSIRENNKTRFLYEIFDFIFVSSF